jgi:predicted nuclease with TOPRIM domain
MCAAALNAQSLKRVVLFGDKVAVTMTQITPLVTQVNIAINVAANTNYVIIGTGDPLNLDTQQAVSFFAHHCLQDRVE